VEGNPVNGVDPFGLLSVLVTTYDYGFGSHSALYIETNGSKYLYDPGGTYAVSLGYGEPGFRNGDGVFRNNEADLYQYLLYQISSGSTVVSTILNLTPEQEQTAVKNAQNIGDNGPGYCARSVSSSLNGMNGISPTWFPGNLARQAGAR